MNTNSHLFNSFNNSIILVYWSSILMTLFYVVAKMENIIKEYYSKGLLHVVAKMESIIKEYYIKGFLIKGSGNF
jgi:hypothetical protein